MLVHEYHDGVLTYAMEADAILACISRDDYRAAIAALRGGCAEVRLEDGVTLVRADAPGTTFVGLQAKVAADRDAAGTAVKQAREQIETLRWLLHAAVRGPWTAVHMDEAERVLAGTIKLAPAVAEPVKVTGTLANLTDTDLDAMRMKGLALRRPGPQPAGEGGGA